MYCGYHNHTHEFDKYEGKTYWDCFAERTSKDVVLQQDCGWTATAGYNPADYIKKYPGRTKVTHFKPSRGWQRLIARNRSWARTPWIGSQC